MGEACKIIGKAEIHLHQHRDQRGNIFSICVVQKQSKAQTCVRRSKRCQRIKSQQPPQKVFAQINPFAFSVLHMYRVSLMTDTEEARTRMWQNWRSSENPGPQEQTSQVSSSQTCLSVNRNNKEVTLFLQHNKSLLRIWNLNYQATRPL